MGWLARRIGSRDAGGRPGAWLSPGAGARRLALSAMAVLAGCATAAPEARVDAAEARAREAADLLFTRLSGELSAAMQAGGPPGAVGVCRDRAPAIAQDVARETGVRIGRTSLRVRNPANAPDAWEREVLEAFEARRAGGEAWSAMEARQVNGAELRWMRPIPTGALCVSCHGGAEVSPATEAALAAAYPRDAARGYAMGDLRGAFTARVPLSPSPR